ncbi:MAG: TonB-dependent receptor [Tannerellaceae bacterium]|nr:TonB-dependent receptor [Tannerellaceae bacterium]
MKITAFLFFICAYQLVAVNTNAQSAIINLSTTQLTIGQLIEEIEKQTEYLVVFSNSELNINRTIHVHQMKNKVSEYLRELSISEKMKYEFDNNYIILSKKQILPEPQQTGKRITGTITDANGEPIIGANIMEKGTSNGTITDVDGKFSFEIQNSSPTLLISYIGYIAQEIAVNDRSQFNVILRESSQALDEVVVVGYGVQKKSVVTGSISSIKSEDMTNSATTRPEQALQGRAAGVQLTSPSGAPGSEIRIRIRGYNSNGDSNPLFIVDGLRTTDISGIDPSNIASMEVLKDGASAAIYGAEGGNGVILITTKTGSSGKAQVSYDFQYTLSSLGRFPKALNAEQYITFMEESNVAPNIRSEWDGTDTDWATEMFEASPMQRHNLTVSGGNENTNYLMSLSYLNQEGIYKGDNDNFNRISGMFNGSQKIGKWLKIGSSIQIAKTVLKDMMRRNQERSTISSIILLDPLTPVVYEPGHIPDHAQRLIDAGRPLVTDDEGRYYGISKYISGEVGNPYVYLSTEKRENNIASLFGNMYADITPFAGFVFTSKLGINYHASNQHTFRPEYYHNGEQLLENYPRVAEDSSFMTYWQWENFASYNKKLGEHNITGLVGTAISSRVFKTISASGYPLAKSIESYADLNFIATQDNSVVGGTTLTDNKLSWFARANYEYAGKYMLQATVRRDAAGLSILPQNERWGTFPAASAGWTLSNEDFFPENKIVTSLKVRGSWGQNGSLANLSNYMYVTNVVSSSGSNPFLYPLGDGSFANAAYPTVLGNYSLKWETTEQWDFGVDFRLFDDKMGFTADYYVKTTKDLITVNTPPLEAGNNASPINGGHVQNKGFDFDLNYRGSTGGGLRYYVSGNFSTLKNEVTYLDPSIARIGGYDARNWTDATVFEQGYPVWYFRGVKTNGVNPATGTLDAIDQNNDGVINSSDWTYIGSAIPDILYGATLNLDYKNFDFTLFLQGQSGNDILMAINRNDRKTFNKLAVFFENRWQKPGDNATYPSSLEQINSTELFRSDMVIMNGSYMKIKQIQLGYSLPKPIARKLQMTGLRVYCSVDDFFTFASYPGMDPETSAEGVNGIGVDRGFFPTSRKLMFGLSLNF